MSVSRSNESARHPGEQLLYWAIVASLLFHLCAYGTYKLSRRYHWMQRMSLPSWLKSTPHVVLEIKQKQPPKPTPQEQQVPLLFVDVDPAAATTEAPKNSKYYSSRNSQAANKEASADTDAPKIDGTQTHLAKTDSATRAKPIPLQPAPAKPEPEQPAAKPAEPKPKVGQPVGNLALAKPAAKPSEKPGEDQPDQVPTPTHKRPNTLVEAKMRQSLAGEKMKQDGGVRRLKLDSLDARATPFGEYDRELIEAIQNRWYDLLDKRDFSRDRTGKVVVDFNLGFDGRVSNLHVIENDVDDLLSYVCQRAILDPAPFAPWPSDMRRLVGGDQREVRFTFFYE